MLFDLITISSKCHPFTKIAVYCKIQILTALADFAKKKKAIKISQKQAQNVHKKRSPETIEVAADKVDTYHPSRID